MIKCLKIKRVRTRYSVFMMCVTFLWLFEANYQYFMSVAASAEDVTASPVRLIPYHSLLSSMFQPVSRRQGVFSSALNNIFPSRRHRKPISKYARPPPRFEKGLRRFRHQRPSPYRKRYPTRSFNKYKRHYGKNRHPSRKPQNSFVPGGIVIDVQPRKPTKIQMQYFIAL